MSKLSKDIWWVIIKKYIHMNYLIELQNVNRDNYMTCSPLFKNGKQFGQYLSSDLCLFRVLCKMSKRIIEKNSVLRYSSYKRRYILYFT